MAAKVPIYLKRGSRRGKKEKLRDLLSSDMISPPLGDFRHTIHVGSGGRADTFGDISFLQGKLHLLPTPSRCPRSAAAPSPSSSSPPPSSPSSVSPSRPRAAANGEAEPFLSHAGSLLSLHVDLGPSILDDVLQVMDRHQADPRPASSFPSPSAPPNPRHFGCKRPEFGDKPIKK
uniref:CDC42 effector protein 2 n=1 Tax=Junco hyemalis TaxID=40217 RepID=A0A8C5IAW7_JUNHY